MLQSNVRQSPYVNMKAALSRRNYVLDRMAAQGYITTAEAEAAKKRPIVTRGQPVAAAVDRAVLPGDDPRLNSRERYGAKAALRKRPDGADRSRPELQRAANRALDAGLRRLDKLRGFRKPARNLLAEKRDARHLQASALDARPIDGDVVPAVVMSVEGPEIRVRVGRLMGTIGRKPGYEWTRNEARRIS